MNADISLIWGFGCENDLLGGSRVSRERRLVGIGLSHRYKVKGLTLFLFWPSILLDLGQLSLCLPSVPVPAWRLHL